MNSRGSFCAVQTIRSFTVEEVVTLLNNNGLGEFSDAFRIREIDGDNLLTLTEGMLALWKRDLTLPAVRKVVKFVSDLNKSPEKYVHNDSGRHNIKKKPSFGSQFKGPSEMPRAPPTFENGRHNTPVKKPAFGSQFKGSSEISRGPPAFKPLPSAPVKSETPISDTESFDSDFENDSDMPPDELYLNYSAAFPVVDVPKPTLFTKPTLPIRPPGIRAGIPPKPISNGGPPVPNPSRLHGAALSMPKPLLNMAHLENIIGNLNLPSVENDDEYFEDEEYEVIDEALTTRPSLGFPTHQPIPLIPPLPREYNHPISPGIANIVDGQNSRPPFIPPLPGGLARAKSPPYPKHTFGGANSRTETMTPPSVPGRGRSPSPHGKAPFVASNSRSEIDVPPNNRNRNKSPPYPKHTFSGVGNRPPIPLPVNPKNQGPTFSGDFNIPPGIPNKMSGYAFKNANQFKTLPSPSKSHFSSSSSKLAISNEHLNHHLSISSSTNDLEQYEDEEYELVDGDSMNEMGGTDYYIQPVQQSQNILRSPSLPPKPRGLAQEISAPQNRPPSPPRKLSQNELVDSESNTLSDLLRVALATRKISGGSSPEMEHREKSPTPELPKSSLFEQKPPERMVQFPTTRPLPPPPDPNRKTSVETMNPRKNSRTLNQMPYYHNVDRKKAVELLKNTEDGKFLLRPSLQTQNQVTLSLWYNKRLYHIGVRQRPDQLYALGTDKAKELTFTSIEELVQFYQGEEMVLFSGGERTGKTLLTSSPPRQINY